MFWCLLTREHDYAYARPSITRAKIRGLELAAGAPPRKKPRLREAADQRAHVAVLLSSHNMLEVADLCEV